MILSTSIQNCVNEYEIATKRSIHLKACCTSVSLEEKSKKKNKKKKEKKKTTHRFQCGKFSLVHDRKVTNHLLMLRTKKSLCSSSQVSIVWFRNYWKLFWFLLCCALRLAFEPTYILYLYVRFHEKPIWIKTHMDTTNIRRTKKRIIIIVLKSRNKGKKE